LEQKPQRYVTEDLFGVQAPLIVEQSPRRTRAAGPADMRVMVTVKAYPVLSRKHGEAVCVAGIRIDTGRPEWVRLFPVLFRDMAFADQFAKYQVVSVHGTRPNSDLRPESWTPDLSRLAPQEKIGTEKGWRARRAFIEPVVVPSMCWVQRQQELDGTSLAAFRPAAVDDFTIEPADEVDAVKAEIAAQRARQGSLWGPGKTPLEPSPYRFRYRYRCLEDGCRGHDQTFIDWEAVAAARNWRNDYAEPQLKDKLREKFLDELCGPARDTVFFVGNQHLSPKAFLVLGVFWPPAQT